MDGSIKKSLKILAQMFQDRKYNVALDSINDTIITENFVHQACTKNGITILIDDKVFLIYQILFNKVDMPSIKKHLDEIENKDMLAVIVITLEKMQPRQINDLKSIKENIEHFKLSELQFNITKHVLVPKHEKLSVEEEKIILETYNLKSKTQLPLILHTDPMSKYLGLKPGNIVKIKRNNSPSSGEFILYRCCV